MPHLKRTFVSLFLSLCAFDAFYAGWILWSRAEWAWIGLLAATLPILYLSVGNLLLHHTATTSRWLPLPSATVALGTLVGLVPVLPGAGSGALWVSFGLLDTGYLVYLLWYSRFSPRTASRIRRGQPLPDFTTRTLDGKTVTSRDLVGSPFLLVFFRGNWCPFCVAQVKELARAYRELHARGVRVVLVSPQAERHTASLAKQFDVPLEFWVDQDLSVARALGLVDEKGLPLGMEALGYAQDTVLPTSILLDERGIVFHDDQTDSYRIRPEPADYLAAFDARDKTAVTA